MEGSVQIIDFRLAQPAPIGEIHERPMAQTSTTQSGDDLDRIQALCAFERRHGLFEARVDGWSPWRVLRGVIQLAARRLPLGESSGSQGKRAMHALRSVVVLASVLVSPPRAKALVKTCRTALRARQGDQFRDVYFDGLLNRGLPYLKLEEVNSPDFEVQASLARHPASFDPIAFSFLGRILGTVSPLGEARAFCQRLSDLLRDDLDITLEPGILLRQLSSVYWQARVYGYLLRRVRPDVVLVSDTGEFGLILAARRCGTRVIELQHGVFDALHRHAIPVEYEAAADGLILPDALACRGQFWVDQLASTVQGALCVPVGNEMIDDARAARSRRDPQAPALIVVSSQGYDTEAVAEWISAMADTGPDGLDWRIVIKMHPSYDANTLSYDRFASHPRVSVQSGSSEPSIFDLLARADLHLSISSACLFDAAALGVRSGLLPFKTHDSLLHAVDNRALTLLTRPQEAWDLLQRGELEDEEAARFARPGFLENMMGLIGDAGRDTDARAQ